MKLRETIRKLLMRQRVFDNRQALETLRASIRQIALATKDPAVIALIPGDGGLTAVHVDKGWNRLALELTDWAERRALQSPGGGVAWEISQELLNNVLRNIKT